MFRRSAPFALAIALVTGACLSEPPPRPDDDAYVSQTIVTIDASGQPSVQLRILTQAEATAEVAAAHARPSGAAGVAAGATDHVAVDPTCAGASLWLFDGPSLTGNQLCLMADAVAGPVSMASFSRCVSVFRGVCLSVAPWTGAVRSYWGGSDPFYFIGTGPECLNCRLPYSRVDDTVTGDGCALRDTAVGFNYPSCTAH
jgi:hypothetical protein